MLVETGVTNAGKTREVDEKRKQDDREFDERLEKIRQRLEAIPSTGEPNSVGS